MSATFQFIQGSRPLLVSMPHTAVAIPEDMAATMTDHALTTPDTDWHLHRLYAFARDLGASLLVPRYSRYVIDLNRDPTDQSLYPGQNTTGLCPVTTFHDEEIYRSVEQRPDAAEIQRRREQYWDPYHAQLADALTVMRARFGVMVLFDAHSIASVVPRFFPGMLPDLNLGTADGTTVAFDLEMGVWNLLSHAGYSSVHNGRFKGGFITRHYGRPDIGIHAIQLEMAQRIYMDEGHPFTYNDSTAAVLQMAVLRPVLEFCLEWAEFGRIPPA